MKTIKIGSQVWTRKNLRVFKFRNGDHIPIVQDADEWAGLQESAMCINPDNGECYYNWYAVNDPRGLATKGFHVPSDKEWRQLVEYCGGNEGYLGGIEKAGSLLKSPKDWDGAEVNKGFNAIPSGCRLGCGSFYKQGVFGNWWSSTPNGARSWGHYLISRNLGVSRNDFDIRNGFSVRLIKD
jgi:uncharacterized protein (TIGR02145 family)